VRKITVVAAIGSAAAAFAIVAGVATAGTTAAAPASTPAAHTVALAAASSNADWTDSQLLAAKIATQAVQKVYNVSATAYSSTATEGVYYEVFLKDAKGVNGFAIIVDVKNQITGGTKEVPANTLPAK
jgi:hypothetical protein